MVRLFIALLLPREVKDKLGELISDLRPRTDSIRWVASGNIHLTLKFIGERPEKDIDPIAAVVMEVVKGRKKVEVEVRGCGGFPNLRRPRVIWAGLEGTDPAAEMAVLLNKRLVPLGIEAERRKFSPHLTIGRLKNKTRPEIGALAEYLEDLNFDAGTAILDQVALVKSTLTSGGPIYENLKIYELE